jgi:hypothetical protein
MVRLFCSEVTVDNTPSETLVSVFCSPTRTSLHVNIKDLCLEASNQRALYEKLLAEEIRLAIGRACDRAASEIEDDKEDVA